MRLEGNIYESLEKKYNLTKDKNENTTTIKSRKLNEGYSYSLFDDLCNDYEADDYKSLSDIYNEIMFNYDDEDLANDVVAEVEEARNNEDEELDESLKEDYEEDRYSLVGQDGNAFSLMGYTAKCMGKCGLRDEIDEMREKAMSDDYDNLIRVCDEYVQRCNEIAKRGELEEEVKKMPRPKGRGWDPDEHLQKVCEYYRNWAGYSKEEVLTEEMLDKDSWRLKRVSSLKNTPVKKIRAELLNQNKDLNEN